jgi:predicted nucleotidyltransferase
MCEMDREKVLTILQQHQAELTEIGVKSLAVFGSVARGEANTKSDLDILVDLHQTPVTFDAYMDVKIYLEDLLDVTVNLVIGEALHPRIKSFVDQDAVYVA